MALLGRPQRIGPSYPQSHRHRSRPVACAQGNQPAGSHSYRASLRQHLSAKFDRQVSWGQHINLDAQKCLQLDLQAPQIEQGGTRESVYQQVEIAAVRIRAMQHRAKHPGVRHAKTASSLTNGMAFELQSERWAHEHFPNQTSLHGKGSTRTLQGSRASRQRRCPRPPTHAGAWLQRPPAKACQPGQTARHSAQPMSRHLNAPSDHAGQSAPPPETCAHRLETSG